MSDDQTTTDTTPPTAAATEPAPASPFAEDGEFVTETVRAPEGKTIHEVIANTRTDDVVDLVIDDETQTAFFKRHRFHVDAPPPNVASESGATL